MLSGILAFSGPRRGEAFCYNSLTYRYLANGHHRARRIQNDILGGGSENQLPHFGPSAHPNDNFFDIVIGGKTDHILTGVNPSNQQMGLTVQIVLR